MVLVVLMVLFFCLFFFPPQFSPFISACVCMWMRRREGGGTRNKSLMFVNCGNSILLNVFFLSEARICYFKCPSSLHSTEKCHREKSGWATLPQLEKQALPRGSHHQAHQWGGLRDCSSPSPLCTASISPWAGSRPRYFLPKGKNSLCLKEKASNLGNTSDDCATKPT